MIYLARIFVTLKPTVNDPQGETVLAGLRTLGFESARGVRAGKYFEILVEEASMEEAEEQVRGMCDRLLANPVMEEFSFRLTKEKVG